jgi:hypothetical protein
MSPRWLVVGVVVALGTLGLSSPAPTSTEVEPAAASRVAQPPAPPDTLQAEATTGPPLILSLPAELGEAPVSRYTLLRGPALSGVAGRSFTWIPTDAAPGTYTAHLQARRPDAAPDTLVVEVTLTR